MNATSYKDFVPSLFKSAEEKDKRESEKKERQRQEREHENGIMLRLAGLIDDADSARIQCDDFWSKIDTACVEQSAAHYAALIIQSVPLKVVANDMAAHQVFKSRAASLKLEVEKIIVGTRDKIVSDFKREHAAIIKKYPPLKKVLAPAFVASKFNEEPSIFTPPPQHPGVRQMLGLKVGEVLKPLPWEQPDNGTIKIRDLDDD